MHKVINCFVHSRTAFWVNKPFIYFVKPYLAMYFKYQSICFHTPTLFSPLPTRATGTQTPHCWILLAGILIPPKLICSPYSVLAVTPPEPSGDLSSGYPPAVPEHSQVLIIFSLHCCCCSSLFRQMLQLCKSQGSYLWDTLCCSVTTLGAGSDGC